MIDAFLELYDANDELIQGESSDEAFPHRIEVDDFSLGDGSARDDDEASPGQTVAKTQDADERMKKVLDALNKLSGSKELVPADKRVVTNALTDAGEVSDLIKDLKKKAGVAADAKDKKAEGGEAAAGKSGGERLTFSVSKDIDAASADLFQAYCRTQVHAEPLDAADRKIGRFTRAVVTIRKLFGGDPHPFLVCTFNEVRLTSYALKYDTGRAILREDVTFKFVSYQMKYQVQTAAGTEGRVVMTDGTVGGKTAKG